MQNIDNFLKFSNEVISNSRRHVTAEDPGVVEYWSKKLKRVLSAIPRIEIGLTAQLPLLDERTLQHLRVCTISQISYFVKGIISLAFFGIILPQTTFTFYFAYRK